MAGTLAIIFGLSTLVFAVILTVAGIGFTLIDIGILVVVLNVGQWLLAPYLIGWIYKVKELKQDEKPELHQMVNDISKKSGISVPKLMLANIPLPNSMVSIAVSSQSFP